MKSVLVLFLVLLIIISSSVNLSTFAHNGSTVAIPIAKQPPYFNKTDPDQIGFGFDINHNASTKRDADDQSIVFIRDRSAEYYKGDTDKLIENSTKPNGSLSQQR